LPLHFAPLTLRHALVDSVRFVLVDSSFCTFTRIYITQDELRCCLAVHLILPFCYFQLFCLHFCATRFRALLHSRFVLPVLSFYRQARYSMGV